MNPVFVFALGMVGALAPEVLRLYEVRSDPTRFQWSWFYLAISVAYAALGGILALVLPATTYWGALYVGVSTPVLINSIVRKGREHTRPQLRSTAPGFTPPKRVARHTKVDSYLRGL